MKYFKTLSKSLVFFLTIFYCQNILANQYFSWLSAEYQNGAVKTFLQGPFESKSFCNELNQITWNNTYTSCGNCKKTEFYCADIKTLQEGYKKILSGKESFTPYVYASKKAKIFFSGISKSVAIDECKRLANVFKENLDKNARCIQP